MAPPVTESTAPRVFLASRNAKKLEEMRRILSDHVPDVEVLGLDVGHCLLYTSPSPRDS